MLTAGYRANPSKALRSGSVTCWSSTGRQFHWMHAPMKRHIHILALSFATCFFATAHCGGANYYIDSVDGDDGNAGTSTNTAWASHTKAESTSLAAGDTVHFKRGSAFSGSIVISESGSPGNPIRLTSYGTGELPKFTNPDSRDEDGNAVPLQTTVLAQWNDGSARWVLLDFVKSRASSLSTGPIPAHRLR